MLHLSCSRIGKRTGGLEKSSRILSLGRAAFWCLPVFFIIHETGHATSVELLEPLDFGAIAILNNDSVRQYQVRSSNRLAVDDGIIIVDGGSSAVFQLSEFPPNTSISVSAPDTSLTRNGAGISEAFDVVDYEANSLITDDLGRGLLYLGATLETSGSGGLYGDGAYLPFNTREVTLEYWSPDSGAFVTEQQAVDLEVTVQNALTLEELQSLSFGTLFVRSDIDSQASLTIEPGGRLTQSQAEGDARMVSLSAPRPGVFELLGAAPNYGITIDLQSDPVFMELENGDAGDPRLVVSDFRSLPAGSGQTDEKGNLEIRVGATVSSELIAPEVYPSGKYRGTYSITLSY
jgi:Domain of unknown function (DUF4402)